jgi:antitoxin component of MazEF toxin-antitoxin module
MIKTLTKFGDSYALVIDQSILDLLNIHPDTPLAISTDGEKLVIAPDEKNVDIPVEQFKEILDGINHRYSNVFKRLA